MPLPRSWHAFGRAPVSKPIGVMHLRASNFIGGPEKQILEHFARLDTGRFRPILGTFVEARDLDPFGDEAVKRGFRCTRFPSLSPVNPSNILQIARVLKKEKIAILCTHGYKPNVLGFCAAKLCGVLTVAISRGWTGESPKVGFYEFLDRRFLSRVDHVVAVSIGQKNKIVSTGVLQKRVSVIHNAINLDDCQSAGSTRIRQELGIPADALLVASAGRLSPEKNYSAMIDVAKHEILKNSSVYFAIFGDGVLRKGLEQRIRDVGLDGRFFLPGFRSDLQAVMNEIDIFMLPSLTEGLPNVALEAFAARKPIVATAVGGTPEVVQDGISGFLTTPGNISAMAESILKLAGDPALRRDMGVAGYRYAAEQFGFEAQTRKYEELYETVYNNRHARP